MGVSSRRKRRTAEQAEELDPRDELDPTDRTAADIEADAEGAAPHDDAPEETVQGDAEEAPRGEHLEDGPYDEADAPDEDRIDLGRSEEHTSELQSRFDLVCRLLLEKKNK